MKFRDYVITLVLAAFWAHMLGIVLGLTLFRMQP